MPATNLMLLGDCDNPLFAAETPAERVIEWIIVAEDGGNDAQHLPAMQSLHLIIEIPGSVTIRSLGNYPTAPHADRLVMFLGNIELGERRLVYTRVQMGSLKAGAMVPIHGSLSAVAAGASTGKPITATQILTAVPEAQLVGQPINLELLQRARQAERGVGMR